MQNLLTNSCSSGHPAMRKATSTVLSRSESSDSDELSRDNSSSPSLSFVSRYSSDSTNPYNKQHFRSIQDEYPHAKPYTHGQAEQLRRSRESTTFALIDAQLSMPPLNQVRDMYLQNRNGCGTNSSGSAARTTKKANLSVVHTVVRFRVKEYLLELLSHIRHSLDDLFCHLYDDYDSKSRDTLASEIVGISGVPCTPDCEFCPELFSKSNRRSSSRLDRLRLTRYPQSETPHRIPSLIKNHSVKSHTSDRPSTYVSPREPIKKEYNFTPQVTCSNEDLVCDLNSFDDHNSTLNNKILTNSFMFSGSNSTLERPLPSYHINMFETRSQKRVRLDSASLRLVNEFDNVDWSADDIDFGPCGEELVDLHTLVTDTTPDLPSKCHEPFFDPAYDLTDLLHQFTNDKYPNLQLAINP